MFANITEIKRANKEIGHYFFSADTMRFFNSTVYPKVYGGRFFVSSEFRGGGDSIRYTVREAQENGAIRSASEFQEFCTRDLAITFAKGLK
jgi:hypothetical protein